DLVEGWATVDAENEELARAFFYDTVAGAEPEEPVEKYTPKTIEVPKVESVTPTSDGAVVKVKEEE
ncbi:phage major tail protein, TP901-1 family, partial [Enterococcus faecalis]|nr:phage major tail protein, TP901-1 family [Enterococcus faecalis]EKL7634526.1 phage major tail protein, TP901-1 family [Enterococcus faecalis]